LADTVYEGMYILDANRYGRDPEGVSGQLGKSVEEAGGEILVSRFWEERRLAYPINGHRKGAYWLMYFRLPSTRLTEVQRKCQLSEDVLRVLFLKVDPRIVDALVAHAKAGTIASYSVPEPPVEKKPAPVAAVGETWEGDAVGE
jgi:small subunit ribosomal protein S6